MHHSRAVRSNQAGPHENLRKVVETHCRTRFDRPIACHNIHAFESVIARAEGRKLVFDSGCGTGYSTSILAQQHPRALVVGIDKSAKRLAAGGYAPPPSAVDNYMLVRANLLDFLRLASQRGTELEKHYFLYPNPWPKGGHLQRRWHGSPIFREILELGGAIELRTNWKIYADEFSLALDIAGVASEVSRLSIEHQQALTPFEKKYHASGQPLWQLQTGNETIVT